MTAVAITFDFHNTLATCDRWFQLETRDLVAAWLRWQAGESDASPDPEQLAAARASYRRLREAIKEHGAELTAEQCVASVLDEMGIRASEGAIARGVDALMRQTLDEARPVPGAIETVRTLAEHGVPLGVVSSAVYHPFLEWTLTAFGVAPAFGAVVTSASAGFYKSRPEIFWHALQALGAQAAGSVHVGDSYRFDVEGAHRAGMRAAWLRRAEAASPAARPPDLTVSTLAGAAPLLLDLLGTPTP